MNNLYCKIKNLPFYILILITTGISGFEKLLGFEVPEWFFKQFSGSVIDIFPNALTIMWILIMILQLTTFLFTFLAIVKKEFQDEVSKKWSQPAFFLTEISFLVLGFGQRITQQYDAAFWLFAYAVLTFLAARIIFKNSESHSWKAGLNSSQYS